MSLIKRLVAHLVGGERSRTYRLTADGGILLGYSGTSSREPASADSALRLSAFFAGVNIVANGVAGLPYKVYRDTGDGRELVRNHPATRLLHRRPNREQTPYRFKWYLHACALTWGNGYAEIERNAAGVPIALWPIHPTRVTWRRGSGGELVFVVSDTWNYGGSGRAEIPDRDLLRVFGFSRDGVTGVDVIATMAETIGTSSALQKYRGTFFGNNATPSGILETPPGTTPEQAEQIRVAWHKRHQTASNAHRVGMLPPGVKWQAIGIDPQASQMIEAGNVQTADFARFLNVPLTRLRVLDKATYSNYEQESRSFREETLLPWVTMFEEETSTKLLSPAGVRSGLYVKASLAAFLRADVATRSKFYADMLRSGVFSVNEVRAWEELSSIGPPGDQHLVQGQMIPLDEAGEGEDAEPTPEDAARSARMLPDPSAFRALVRDAAGRACAREAVALRKLVKRNGKPTDELVAAAGSILAEVGDHRTALLPSVDTIREITPFVPDLDRTLRDHVAEGREDFRRLAESGADLSLVLDEWTEVRAESLTENIFRRPDNE